LRHTRIDRRKFVRTAGAGAFFAGAVANSEFSDFHAAEAGHAPEQVGERHREMLDGDFARLITLDPAHFHAALIQKEMAKGISPRVAVFAPLGPDLLSHLNLIEQFNLRTINPTHWELDVHCTARSLEEMVATRPGNVVVLAGHNQSKISKIKASLEAGLNVLADKPWIIRAEDLPQLEAALALAGQKGLVAYDIMTERHEITSILQRELVADPNVFGTLIATNPANPAVEMESTHHILKAVNGTPSPRPPFFFDIHDQGEGLTDVGTHLVDLVQWTLFPNQALDHRRDVHVQGGKRWPTPISLEQFRQITGAQTFPAELAPYVHGDVFAYACNNQLDYQLRGVQVRVRILWNWESPAGVDFHHATYRGTRASVEVRQTARENYRPELFVKPASPELHAAIASAISARLERLQSVYPGTSTETTGDEVHITIPDRYRVGHEAHFAQVVAEFLQYLQSPKSIPAWERSNMLAKYFTTTMGAQMSVST